MRREAELRHRLRMLQTMGEAVGAMKNLSAHHFQKARNELEPARDYRTSIDRILQGIPASIPAGNGPAGIMILGSELGLCGAYNSQLIAAASEHRAKLGDGPTICLGRRTSLLLARHDLSVQHTYSAPTSGQGITRTLLELLEALIPQYIRERWSAFDVVSHRFEGVGAHRATVTRLLPLVTHPGVDAPQPRYVSEIVLTAVAARELLYVTLYELLLDALAAEHGARLIATHAAESWLDERIQRILARLTSARREDSTQEVIEIAAGARARRSKANDSRR